MAKIQLDISRELHSEIKKIQLDRESKGEINNLKQIYEELIQKGLAMIKKDTHS